MLGKKIGRTGVEVRGWFLIGILFVALGTFSFVVSARASRNTDQV